MGVAEISISRSVALNQNILPNELMEFVEDT